MAYKQLSQKAWNKKVLELAETFLYIRECKKCGSPAMDMYCCSFCGDSNPDQTIEQEKADE
jgi:hypothetical protein